MIDTVYNWVKTLAFFSVLSTAALQMVPDHGFQKYVRFFTGLLMVSMLVLPILKIIGKEEPVIGIYKNKEYRGMIEKNNEERQDFINQIKILEKNADETPEEGKAEANIRIEVEQIEIGKDRDTILEE